jgi:hypothetical protein
MDVYSTPPLIIARRGGMAALYWKIIIYTANGLLRTAYYSKAGFILSH